MNKSVFVPILRWDAVLPNGNVQPFPMIYVKEHSELIKLVQQNQGNLILRLTNTKSIYDDRVVIGVVRSSATTPNDRPNFYNNTHTMVIILYAPWKGYPDQLGQIEILNTKEVLTELKNTEKNQSSPGPLYELYTSSNKTKTWNIVLPIIIVVVILLGIFLFIRFID